MQQRIHCIIAYQTEVSYVLSEYLLISYVNSIYFLTNSFLFITLAAQFLYIDLIITRKNHSQELYQNTSFHRFSGNKLHLISCVPLDNTHTHIQIRTCSSPFHISGT